MGRKYTADEWEAKAKKAEELAKKYREKAANEDKAEKAKRNIRIISIVEEWAKLRPDAPASRHLDDYLSSFFMEVRKLELYKDDAAKLSTVAGKYGCSISELIAYISEDRQIEQYRTNLSEDAARNAPEIPDVPFADDIFETEDAGMSGAGSEGGVPYSNGTT